MATKFSDDDLRRYAALVRNRDQFGDIFDAVSQGRTLTFKFIALLNPVEPYFEAFNQANKRGKNRFLVLLLEKLLHAGVLSNEQTSQEKPVSSHLEAITRPDLGFPNVELEISGKLTATRRLCCISVLSNSGGTVIKSGTGFLIGPQTVLTSYHVICDLLSLEGTALPGSANRLRITFDELNGFGNGVIIPVHKDWLAEHSKLHWLEDPASEQPLDWDNVPDDGFDTFVDCAIIRLSKTIGRERGYYRLESSRIPEVNNGSAQVGLLQHPSGGSLASTAGVSLKLWPKTHLSRFHHDANSAPGSSGGLIVDNEFRPVGLHQCSYKSGNKVLYNGAITTASIAKLNLIVDNIVGFDPIWDLSSGEPVIGREEFQSSVLDAVQGNVRILTVGGNAGMGRTFTTKILREMLGSAEHHFVEVSASRLSVTGQSTALMILLAVVGNTVSASDLPETTEAETAQAAWIRGELFPAFTKKLLEFDNKRLIWLIIDDLDKHRIANTSTRLFLETLYANIATIPNLRIVLLGFEGTVPGATSTLVQGEVLREFNVLELERYIERKSTALMITRPKGEANRIAQTLLDLEKVMGRVSKDKLATLALHEAKRG